MNEDRLPMGQRLYKQRYQDAVSGSLFVPVTRETLEALSAAAKVRGVGGRVPPVVGLADRFTRL